MNPRDSLLVDEGSAGLRFHGSHGRLGDKGTLNAGRDSCDNIHHAFLSLRCYLHEPMSLTQWNPLSSEFIKVTDLQACDCANICFLNVNLSKLPFFCFYVFYVNFSTFLCENCLTREICLHKNYF